MRKLLIIDETDGDKPAPVYQTEKLSDDFGRNLDTVAKAKLWLTNPHNWHEGHMYILKWNGLLPTVNRTTGMRLVDEPHDDGLPMVVIRQQYDLRNGKKEITEPEPEE